MMTRLLLTLSLLALPACIVLVEDREVRSAPIREQPLDPCDLPEVFGDGIDSDCDGHPDARIDYFEAPARTAPLTFAWADDLRSLGGLLVLPTGELVAQDLFLDDGFGGRVVLKRRSDYGPASDARLGVRLEGPLDIVARAGQLQAWTPDRHTGSLHWSAPLDAPTGLDAAHGPGGTWIVACDGAEITATHLALGPPATALTFALDHPATTCALLTAEDRPLLITAAQDAPIERWVLDPQLGLTDWLRIADRTTPDRLVTASHQAHAAFAFTRRNELLVFDRSATGTVLGQGVSERFDLAIGPDGAVLITWLDDQDLLWVALGSLPDGLIVRPIATFEGAQFVTAGIADDEIGVAVLQGPTLALVRALRP